VAHISLILGYVGSLEIGLGAATVTTRAATIEARLWNHGEAQAHSESHPPAD